MVVRDFPRCSQTFCCRLSSSCSLATVLVGTLVATPALAQAEEPPSDRIRDNLFLLEEAYNQEPGVIQHISVFQYAPHPKEWMYSFTEEWPVPTDLNQLSVTLNVGGAQADGSTGVGDTFLNYRFQALGLGGEGWIAVAPRLSLVIPTGDPKKMTGRGSIGVQVNLPVSMELGRFFAIHLNGGATIILSAQSPGGRSEMALDANAGAALVWQPVKWINPLVEISYAMTEEVGDASSEHVHSLVVNPGLRFAIDHARTGLQVVPGISVPMQVAPRGDFEAAVLAYLSFEHPAF